MLEKITAFIVSVIPSPFWATVIASAVPLIEARGALPLAYAMGLSPWLAYLACMLSSFILCPMLFFLVKPFLRLFPSKKTEAYLAERAAKLGGANMLEYQLMFAIFIFVAIPAPMTGVFAGAAIASFLNMRARFAVPGLIMGNAVAISLVSGLTALLGDYYPLLFYFVLATAVAGILGFVIKLFAQSRKTQR